MTPISWTKSLTCYQNDVHEVTNEEEAESGELEQTYGGISKIEPVNAEHSQEHR